MFPKLYSVHPANKHNESYQFNQLIKSHPPLKEFVFTNEHDTETIDFSNSDAVFNLNKALLIHHYGITDYSIPTHYLCPPIPGRADYLYYLNDIIEEAEITGEIKVLDIGVGANCIYPILGSRLFDWKMVGTDINETAVESAKANVKASEILKDQIEIRHQKTPANIFEGIIAEKEYYHLVMCNPPFHVSEEEASKGTLRKLRNLDKTDGVYQTKKDIVLNFGGQANELWCNGGEALFLKRMIKQSASFKTQVGWFTSLVSKRENLNKLYKQLDKLKASHKTVVMTQGNKKSRILIWKF